VVLSINNTKITHFTILNKFLIFPIRQASHRNNLIGEYNAKSS